MTIITSSDSTRPITESVIPDARSQELTFEDKVKQQVAVWYACRPDEVYLEQLKTGLSGNRVFLVQAVGYETVVKEFSKEQEFLDESKALEVLSKLPLTKIQGVSQQYAGKISHEGKEVYLMAQSKAKGEPVLKTLDQLPKKYVQVAVGLAELHAQGPVQDVPDFLFLNDIWAITDSIMPKLEMKAQKSQAPSLLSLMPLPCWKASIDELLKSVQKEPCPAAFVHGDPQPDNTFVSDQGMALIDSATLVKSIDEQGKGKGCAARDFYYFVERTDEQLFLAGMSVEERHALKKLFEETYRKAMGDKMPSQEAMRFFSVRINLGIVNKNLELLIDKKISAEKIEPFLREKIDSLNLLLN